MNTNQAEIGKHWTIRSFAFNPQELVIESGSGIAPIEPRQSRFQRWGEKFGFYDIANESANDNTPAHRWTIYIEGMRGEMRASWMMPIKTVAQALNPVEAAAAYVDALPKEQGKPVHMTYAAVYDNQNRREVYVVA